MLSATESYFFVVAVLIVNWDLYSKIVDLNFLLYPSFVRFLEKHVIYNKNHVICYNI